MALRGGRRLVIDADVARGAGTTDHPTSQCCRRFLDSVMANRVRLAWCDELAQEWRRHQSTYATRWLAAMASKRRVVWLDAADVTAVGKAAREAADAGDLRPTCAEVIDKDLHLVGLARAADRAVASLDENARRCLAELCDVSSHVGTRPLRRIVWVNPERDHDQALDWAQAGCPDRAVLRLVRDR